MLKACKYCGRIHTHSEVCQHKPQSSYIRDKEIQRFRNSKAWRDKRDQIKERDRHLCQACLNNLPHTLRRINSSKLSVHHISPLKRSWALRLEDDNLITLCDVHHEQAEKGAISATELRQLIQKSKADGFI